MSADPKLTAIDQALVRALTGAIVRELREANDNERLAAREALGQPERRPAA